MKISAYSHIGGRENNEDSYYVDPNKHFAILADGMGGHAAGEKASEIAVNVLKKRLSGTVKSEKKLLKLLNDGVREANTEIFKKSAEHLKYRGMGTTLSVVYLLNDKLYYLNIGDSRIYGYGDELFQISKDDSFVNYLLDIGDISEEEARVHPKKNVLTKALGTAQGVDFEIRSLEENLRFIVLCSDGLSDVVDIQNIEKILESEEEDYSKRLVQEALDCDGKDNITVIVFDSSR
ncbi:MAG: Stp1/IreP family PP2C-type Ser/Thr phosphatase [Peptoniphilus sp.]|nr:Stp1/IreP family PP2C-type Ser/Thr phosphatase [Peptoniphilus sp.]MDD7362946.1 Stp1/IreP family PP2C-type Ser/Thr phosphatase [Bacillota bacterium]MDY6044186.1 Stp1/IreP family PP2C-type Ser/Thr phosphatase [Peptoniphilus sp.]